jgi:hypothetical protein
VIGRYRLSRASHAARIAPLPRRVSASCVANDTSSCDNPEPAATMPVRRTLHLLTETFGAAAAIAPRRLRFPLITAAAWISAVIRRIGGAIGVRRRALAAIREQRLAHYIALLEARRLLFDPHIEVIGLELLASAAGEGVFVATTHANAGLSRLILRVLHDRNIAYDILSAAPAFPVCGAAVDVPCLAPQGAFLLTVRRRLQSGGLVLAMLDSGEQIARASVMIETNDGPFWISEPLLRIAQRSGARVLFMRGSLRGGSVVIEFVEADASRPSHELARELAAYALRLRA